MLRPKDGPVVARQGQERWRQSCPVLLIPIHSSNNYLLLCAGTVLGSVHTSVNKTDHSACDLEWLVGETAIKRNKKSI